MNNLYNSLGNNNLVQQFQKFKSNFKGDAREQVQSMLNSGKISQADYNRAVQMANQLKGLLK